MAVRGDLTPGQQAVQAGHAALKFAHLHPGGWHDGYLIIVSVPDEEHLVHLLFLAGYAGVDNEGFWEPDLGDQLTAIALGEGAERLCRKYPLALSQQRGGEDK